MFCTRVKSGKETQGVADFEELVHLGAPEIHARLNAQEVITPNRSEKLMFPIADWRVHFFGWDQVLRTSTLIQDLDEGAPGNRWQEHLGRGEAREDLRREPYGSEPSDSFPEDSEARNNFWSISGNYIYRHHVYQKNQTLCQYTPNEVIQNGLMTIMCPHKHNLLSQEPCSNFLLTKKYSRWSSMEQFQWCRTNLDVQDPNQIHRHQTPTRRHTDKGQFHRWWV